MATSHTPLPFSCHRLLTQVHKKAQSLPTGLFRFNNGRDGVIRTLDPLHPMQVRYRAALRPDWALKHVLNPTENVEEFTLTS